LTGPDQSPDGALVRHVVTFGRVLREAGLEVGPGRISDALAGLDRVDIGKRDDVYWTLRTTLVSRADDIESFDRAFAAWFLRSPSPAPLRHGKPQERRSRLRQRTTRTDATVRDDRAEEPTRVGWSVEEVLREKDFAAMTADEFAAAARAMRELAAARPLRRSRRLRPHARGRNVDLRRLARRSLARGGDPIEQTFRRRVEVPRKLVVLCDVSGSMEAYTRALLLFLHAVVGSGRAVEVFAFGTRLTRLTDEFRTRDPEHALEAATGRVVDWAGGTRIGASLKTFNDVWGRRALTRGAAVVIVSDGWEREDADLIPREMARLHRSAYAIVWVNPLKGSPEYQPLAGGMRAALPHVDRFLSGHNLASLEKLADVLAGIERRHAA
jgi:uncharacterized protein with von Willebrand factor type A (vWA) domain